MSSPVPPRRLSQAEIIKWVDEKTDAQVQSVADNNVAKNPSRIALILRLAFLPPVALVSSLLIRRNLFRGFTGIKQAGAEWAFAFVYAAKRYEYYYADDTALKKRYRDFME